MNVKTAVETVVFTYVAVKAVQGWTMMIKDATEAITSKQ